MADLFIGNEALEDFSGGWKAGERAELESESLVTHAFVCGATGSGKTVLAKGIVEEALRAGIPVIAIDLKGDIASMALTKRLAESASLESIFGSDTEAVRSGYLAGLRSSSAVAELVDEYDDAVEARIFSPRSKLAEPIALSGLPAFAGEPQTELEREEREALIEALARGLVDRMHAGRGSPAKRKSQQKLVEELMLWATRQGRPLVGEEGIYELQRLVATPPITHIGGMPIDDHSPERKRTELRHDLANLVAGAGRQWFLGRPLSVETLLDGGTPGRTRLSVIYMGHVVDSLDHGFVVAQVCTAIYEWMRRVPSTGRLRLLLYIDELGGGGGPRAFLPSHPYNPASKAALSMLIKQGRSAGVGCVLATQNPMDVDRHSLANVGTWAVGRLREEADGTRLRAVMSEQGIDARRAIEMVRRLQPHHFMLTAPGVPPQWIRERWLYSIHQQLNPQQVERLAAPLREPRGAEGAPRGRAGPAAGRGPAPVERHVRARRYGSQTPAPPDDGATMATLAVLAPEPSTLPTLAAGQGGASAVPRRWYLQVGDSERHPLGAGVVSVGRSRGAGITVRGDDYLSGQHFELVVRADGVTIRPLKAKNATKVDGEAVRAETVLLPKDAPFEIRAGSTRFEVGFEVGG